MQNDPSPQPSPSKGEGSVRWFVGTGRDLSTREVLKKPPRHFVTPLHRRRIQN